jgi:hypothetical protein
VFRVTQPAFYSARTLSAVRRVAAGG